MDDAAKDQAEGDERLLRLADKLLGEGAYARVGPVQVEEFDLMQWFAIDFACTTLNNFLAAPVGCGTTACTIGHAVADEWFSSRGLETHWDSITDFFCLAGGEVSTLIGGREDMYLFSMGAYVDDDYVPDPKTVAERLREFVVNRQGTGA